MCDSVTVSFNVVLHPANVPLFCRREHIGPRANLCKWVCVKLLQWSQSSCVSVMSYNVQAWLRLANRHHRESNSICWVWICSLFVYYIPCAFLDIILILLIHRANKWDPAGWRLNVTLAADRMCDSKTPRLSDQRSNNANSSASWKQTRALARFLVDLCLQAKIVCIRVGSIMIQHVMFCQFFFPLVGKERLLLFIRCWYAFRTVSI